MKNKKSRPAKRQSSQSSGRNTQRSRTNAGRPIVTAILVDGGFYRRKARTLFGDKEPEDRANELVAYCKRHIRESEASLYRIFYYDCLPSEKVIYHPLLQKQINLGKSDEHAWNTRFLKELVKRRKVALRRGGRARDPERLLTQKRTAEEAVSRRPESRRPYGQGFLPGHHPKRCGHENRPRHCDHGGARTCQPDNHDLGGQ